MESKDSLIYKIISVLLIIGIVILLVDVIIPRYTTPKPEKILESIDFSTSAWIEQYIEQTSGTFGKDFYINTAFTYNIRSNKLVVTYASQNSVEEAREYFQSLPGAQLVDRNDETSLNVTAEIDGQDLRVYNYYSLVSRVFELELTLTQEDAENVIKQLEMNFPDEELEAIQELRDFTAGEKFGGYVRYIYDTLDAFFYPNQPIYSRAYLYSGTEEGFLGSIEKLRNASTDSRFDDSQNSYYFKILDQIISIGKITTDSGDAVVTISVQVIPPED
jgi:hypothetical protein